MKILHVMTHFSATSGVARLISSIIPCQKKQGYSVDVMTLTDSVSTYAEEIERLGCNYIPLQNARVSRYNPIFIIQLMFYLNKYDIVHVHMFPSIYWVVIAKIFLKAKCKLVMTEHATFNNRQGKWLLTGIEKFVYRHYDSIIAVSNVVKENLLQFVDKHLPIVVITNGVELTHFRHAIPVHRSTLGISDEAVLIIQVAGFRPEKDQLTLLNAIKRLPRNYCCIFVGTGETLGKHKQEAVKLGISERVYFLGLREDVPALIKTADIVVMSSHYEGFGLVAVEGMAAGKPVIASDVPGLREVVEGAGLIFPVHDDKILSNEILHLSEDPFYAEAIRQRCLLRAEEYDIQIMADKYDKVYKRIMNCSI